ncbi:DoxX family protein [Thalassobacillus hwangdonensis]|uniref:DoxX family protein n=1 Tax=Thalassobacillus hwangdonensis TaxID=546108 RepID=A0ABW3L1Q4_9BACI
MKLTTLELVRYAVAFVFITSGLMKLLGTGLGEVFVSLGIPYPISFMYALATLEIACGVMLIMNRYVKYAAVALLIVIIGAILMTKVPALHDGLVQALFSARLDIVMLVLLIILYRRTLDVR